MLIDAARVGRHAVGCRWFVDETYVKVAGVWRYVYRAVDGYGQVIVLRHLTLNPDRQYQPTGNPIGGPRRPDGPRKRPRPEPQ